MHHLESLNLPYADDSNAVTPCSDDIRLCSMPSKFSILANRRASMRRAIEDASRRSSNVSQTSQRSHSRMSPHATSNADKLTMLMGAFDRKNKAHHLSPDVYVDKSKLDDNVSEVAVSVCHLLIYLYSHTGLDVCVHACNYFYSFEFVAGYERDQFLLL